jgi:hypothetical protein
VLGIAVAAPDVPLALDRELSCDTLLELGLGKDVFTYKISR